MAETILSVVESNRKCLTDKDPASRIKALNKINLCIKDQVLNVREVAILTEFYRERLKDSWEVHGSAMEGLYYLVQQEKYPGSAVTRLLPTLSQELHVPTLSIENRLHCGKMFQELHKRQRQWLEQVGPSFCNMVVSSFDGETDPRVLLVGFNLFGDVMAGGLAGANEDIWDELLDVVMCYFPVDFEPDGSDNITRADLVNALSTAMLSGLKSGSLTAKKRHSAALIDLICEKLGSDSTVAIDDAIIFLDRALPLMNKGAVDKKLKEFIQIMVINIGQREQDNEGQDKILTCLKGFAESSKGTELAVNGLDLLFAMVGEYLKPPFKATLWPAIKCLKAWSASGVDVMSMSLPNLIPGLAHPSSAGEALDSIVELANSSTTGNKNSCLEEVLLKSIVAKEVPLQTKLLSVSAVAACAKSNLISQGGLESITLEVFDLATKSDSLELCREASHCLSYMAEKSPNFIRDNIIPKLDGNALKQETFVLLLCQFINNEGFLPFEICHKLIQICITHQFDKAWDASILAALSGLKTTVPNIKSAQVKLAIAKCFLMEMMDGLVQAVMYCGQDKKKQTILLSEAAMEDICYLTRFLVRQLDNSTVLDFSMEVWHKFTANTSSKGSGMSKIYFKPFEPSYAYSKNQSIIIPFFTSFFCTATPTTLPGNFNEYTQFCLTVLKNGHSEIYHIKAVAKILAAVINKHGDDDIDEKIWAAMNDFMIIRNQCEESLTLAIWVAKAILLKGGKGLDAWLDKLIAFTTGSKEVGRVSADAWWLLLGPTPDLSIESGAVVKLLHPQRLFNMTLPKIKNVIDGRGQTMTISGPIKENMLVILGHLLSLIPSEVQSRELPPLLPLLFEALSSADGGLVESALQTISQLFQDGSPEVGDLLSKHVETLVSEFLRVVYSSVNLRVRCEALRCLRMVARMDGVEPVLVRNRGELLLSLRKALDDPKRIVRKQATLTANIWAMVGQE